MTTKPQSTEPPDRIWIDTDDVAGARRRGVGSYYVRPALDDASNREAEYVRPNLAPPASAAPVVDRLFEAKLLGFEEEWRIRLCEPCVKRATEDSLVIFACALPMDNASAAATAAPVEHSDEPV